MNPEGHRRDQLRVGLAENRQRQASGDAVDPVRRPDTLQNGFDDLRDAIDDLGRVVAMAVRDTTGLGTLHRRIVERFNWLVVYVHAMPIADVTSWKRIAWFGWAVALMNLGVLVWVKWFQ